METNKEIPTAANFIWDVENPWFDTMDGYIASKQKVIESLMIEFAKLHLSKQAEVIAICKSCGGSGHDTGMSIDAVCCGNATSYGSCCNQPIPKRTPVQVPCEDCGATGYQQSILQASEEYINNLK